MKKIGTLMLLLLLTHLGGKLFGQDIDFTLRYNPTAGQYEVYGLPDFTDPVYFVGGGSQISLVLPNSISDTPLQITTVNGGFWTDNSQVYAPAADPAHDFHGIASNGSPISLVAGEELLLYTFTLPGGDCVTGLRLFINGTDPNSAQPGMGGGDFENYFANVFTFEDNYNANYNNTGTICNPPIVIPNPITIPMDSIGMVCVPIFDVDAGDTFTATNCGVSHGSTTVTAIGNELCVEYMPNQGYVGTDSICLIICDQTGLCDTTTIPVTIIGPLSPTTIPEPPIVIITPVTTPKDSTVTICSPILDPNTEDTFTALPCASGPNDGAANITVDGNELCVEYTPDSGFVGDDEVCVIVCDNTGLCDTVVIPITVSPTIEPPVVPQPPIVVTPPLVTPEDSTTTICAPITDPNPEDTHTATICEQPTNGTAVVVTNNATDEVCITYDPDQGYSGADSICVVICDQTGLCDTITVPVEVLPNNEAPIAVDDINITPINTPTSGDLLTNDEDPDGDNLTVNTTPIGTPVGGIPTINPNGTYVFTPTPGFTGEATFDYEICDDGSPQLCDTATVVIEVIDNTAPDNNAPIGVEDNFLTEEGDAITSNLTANDTDPDGDNLTINTTPVTAPTDGTLVINPDGTFTYTPDPGFEGEDTFEYQICDDGTPQKCDVVLVTIEVLPDDAMNDTYATDDAGIGNEDKPITGDLLANDTDPEGDIQTINTTPKTSPMNGTVVINPDGTYEYTPNPDFAGNDQFVYEVCDNGTPVACDSATVYLTVLAVNEVVAIDDINTTFINNPVDGNVLTNDDDPEGDHLTVNTIPVGTPVGGTVSLQPDGTYTFTPTTGFTGEATFNYEVCDDGSPVVCDTARVVIEVIDNTAPDNNSPIGVEDNFITEEGVVVTGSLISNDTDPDGDNITINTTPVTAPTDGTLVIHPDGTFTYTPDPGFEGKDTFEYQICDDGTPQKCDVVLVTIEVLPDNAVNNTYATDDAGIGNEDALLTGNLLSNDTDPEGDMQTINTTPVTSPTDGTLVINPDGTYEYTPNPDFAGNDQFVYEVCDNGTPVACDTATVYLTILPVNEVVAIDDINTTQKNTSVDGNVLTNDDDPEGDNLVVNTTPVGTPVGGTVSLQPDGTYTFTPTTDFTGEATFNYEVCDDGRPVACDTATVVIEVFDTQNPNNNSVVGVEDNFVTEEGAAITGSLTSNDFDPDGDNITINTTPVTAPTDGMLVINPDGTFTYTPDPDFVGADNFEYQVCDDGTPQTCDVVLVTIEVLPDNGVNDTYATDDTGYGTAGTSIMGDVSSNDTDPEGDLQTYTTTPISGVSNGIVVLNTDGTFTYTPTTGFIGNDQFVYEVCDNGTPIACDTATVYLTVTDMLNPPVVIPTPITTPQDSIGEVCILITDTNVGDTFTTTICGAENGTPSATTIGSEVCLEYIPDAGFTGTDSICIIVCDQTEMCDTTFVPVTVVPTPLPSTTEEPPIVITTPITTEEGTPTTVCTPILDPNIGDTFTAMSCSSGPNDGTANLSINGNELCVEYTPDANFSGEDEVCVIVCDQTGLCDTVMIPVTVIPTPVDPIVPQAPVGVVPPAVGPADDPITVCGPIVDPNLGDTHTVSICEQPMNGTATAMVDNATGQVCVTVDPTDGFVGDDEVCLIVCDQTGLCDTLTVPITIIERTTKLVLKVMLQGAMFYTNDGLMRDDLKTMGLVPLTQPYSSTLSPRFTQYGGGSEVTTSAILSSSINTPDAIVDWIFVELRSSSDATAILRTVSALVQRDGDIVDAVTGNTLCLNGLPATFYVAVKHRNHLGTMTANPQQRTAGTVVVDFTTLSDSDLYHFGGYDGLEMTTVTGLNALWAGNANADGKVKYDGSANDRIKLANDVLTNVGNTSLTLNYDNAIDYLQGDIDMNGKAKYDGSGNDRILIQNVVLTYPLNTLFLNNYNDLLEQLP